MDIKQMLQLKVAGKSNRFISQLLGRSRNTINEYVKLFNQLDQSLEELSLLPLSELNSLLAHLKSKKSPSDERYENLVKHKQGYFSDLKRPGATYQTIWYQYRASFPNGYGYTQFKKHLKELLQKSQPKAYSMPISHKYGDKLFIDFTGKKLSVVNRETGEEKKMEVFVAVLGGSNYTYVEACKSQNSEDFIRCTINCLEYMGGVPQALVPDNLKSAVTKADKYEATINRQYQAMALHYDTVVYPTRAAKPQDKALVEGAVKLVYQRIFFHLSKQTFFSLTELNEQLHQLLEQYNHRAFYKQTESRLERYIKSEKHLLKPLPPHRFEPKTVKRAKVQRNSHVWLNAHYYSVPYSYMGKYVQVHFNSKTVEVYYNYERIAIHKYCEQSWTYTTIKEHMASQHQFVMDWNPKRFIRWGKKNGTATGTYIEKVLAKSTYPEQAYKSCMGILNLAKKYSSQRLEKACARGLQYEKYSYRTIERILSLAMDKIEEDTQNQLQLPLHDNIRGANYYD